MQKTSEIFTKHCSPILPQLVVNKRLKHVKSTWPTDCYSSIAAFAGFPKQLSRGSDDKPEPIENMTKNTKSWSAMAALALFASPAVFADSIAIADAKIDFSLATSAGTVSVLSSYVSSESDATWTTPPGAASDFH